MNYEGGGDVSKGGFFVHYRDGFGRCAWAFAVAVHGKNTLNLKVITNSPDQMLWKTKVRHGAGKEEWHHPDQCGMDAKGIIADEAKLVGEKQGAPA